MSPPSCGDNGGDLGSARGQAEIEVPIREWGHLPSPRAAVPGGHLGEDLVLLQPAGMNPALAAWVSPVPEGIRGPGAGREVLGAGSCLPLLPARRAPSRSCSPRPSRSFQNR